MTSVASRYASAATRLSALVDAVAPDAWDRPSPCEGWTARQVLEHVVSTEADFLGQRELAVPDVSGLAAERAWPVLRAAVQAALDDEAVASRGFDGYFGPTTIGETVDRFYTLDLLVHRWDIATATGLAAHAPLDAGEIAHVRTCLGGIPAEIMRSPGLFGPALDVAAGADDTTALMRFLGRAG
jgi:uncharacterized protein (TIGR03086 family)